MSQGKDIWRRDSPKGLQGNTHLMSTSRSPSMESALNTTMPLGFIESCRPKKKLCPGVATRLAIRKGAQGRNSNESSPCLTPDTRKISGSFILSLKWERQWIWLLGPPHCQRKVAPFVNKLLEDEMHDVITVSTTCVLPGVREGVARHTVCGMGASRAR